MLFLLLLLLFFSCGVCHDDPATRSALLKFWNETNGQSWDCAWNLTEQSYCSFSGVVCDSEANVIGLLLSNCGMSGFLSEDVFAALPFLQEVLFGVNRLTGPVPQSLFRPSLVVLQLEENDFVGTLPIDLTHLKNLTTMNLANNRFTGAIPKLPDSVTSLFLQYNGFSSGISNTANLPNLMYLRAHDNVLTERLPSFQTPSLVEFHVSNNALSGIVDFGAFFAMPNITVIDFSQNLLMGELPNATSSLRSVHVFRAGYNQLSGQIVVRKFVFVCFSF